LDTKNTEKKQQNQDKFDYNNQGRKMAIKVAKRTKINNKLNVNNPVKSELPFTERDILNILKIVDVALADEKTESEIRDWMKLLYEPMSSDEIEELHRKVHFYLLGDNNNN
jgi:hypothetical protein